MNTYSDYIDGILHFLVAAAVCGIIGTSTNFYPPVVFAFNALIWFTREYLQQIAKHPHRDPMDWSNQKWYEFLTGAIGGASVFLV